MRLRWFFGTSLGTRSQVRSLGMLAWTGTTLAGCSKDPVGTDTSAESGVTATIAATSPESPEEASSQALVASEGSNIPLVNLRGESARLTHAAVTKGPRIYSTQLLTWIYEKPSEESKRLGYLRAGSSVPTTPDPVSSVGCAGGWYPASPRGFICVGSTATLDGEHPIVQLFEQHPPRADQRLPYRYGTVKRPGAVYGRLPKRSELPENETLFEEKFLEWLSADGEHGASFRPEIWSWGTPSIDAKRAWADGLTAGVPPFLSQGKNLPSVLGRPRPDTLVIDRMASRVGHSFLETFYSEGRRYGLTTQLELMPLDRYRPIAGSDFHGVEIGKDVEFPFAYVRRVGSKFSDGSPANYRDVLELSGKKKQLGGRLHYETVDGKFISDKYASELTLAKKMPAWATNGEKWISVSITKQTLVLYEGIKPVYATLVSTGEAGLDDHETSTATKRGIFRIHTKHVSSTMSSDEVGEEFELRDVPYVQYFAEGGYALHGAYWHDRFGTPKSHGCINLAPEDARRIFYWTDPPVPTGWHGALLPLTGTRIFVHP